jgi:hypothetical protein
MQHSMLLTLREAALPAAGKDQPPRAGGDAGAPRPPRWGLGRALQAAAAVGAAAFAVLLSTSGSTGCGTFCDGGYVRKVPGNDEGICEGKCDPSKCLAGNTCVDNKCVLVCTSHLECDSLTQECVPAKEDDTNKAISVCQPTGRAPIGAKCPFGNECDTLNACPDGSACDFTQCGGQACTADTNACAGVENCKTGICPDKTPCTVPGCTQDQCKPLSCLSAGAGDADAYCTKKDCMSDDQCPGGYWCTLDRDPHDVCGPKCNGGTCSGGLNDGGACSKDGDCQKGNNTFCGKTTDMCIDPATANMSGGTYQEGQYCMLRKECKVRGSCDPCATDVDCSLIPGQHCTQVGSEKVCTRDCGQDTDCDGDFECKSGACVPRAGSCTGTGAYCDHCRNDADCGGPDSKLACRQLTGNEKACVDEQFSTMCTTDNDCPVGPDGKHGTCMGPDEGVSPGDQIYQRCYVHFNTATNKFSCWCSKTGGECLRASECCSNKCIGANPNSGIVGHCQ